MSVRNHRAWTTAAATTCLAWTALVLAGPGCTAPIGADRASTARVYRQIHQNPVSDGVPSADARFILRRFEQGERFEAAPDEALEAIGRNFATSRDPELLFALSELYYLAGERLRRSVKPWEPRDARDYYLASAVHAWLFLFGAPEGKRPDGFDPRFRDACDLYNFALGRALLDRRATNAVADLSAGVRSLPSGEIEVARAEAGHLWASSDVSHFLVADQFLVRGLSVRNRQPGLGTPLVAVQRRQADSPLQRTMPATVLLRVEGGWDELVAGRLRGVLELYSPLETSTVRVHGNVVPLEADTTVATAYGLNQSFVWSLGMRQFYSSRKQVQQDLFLPEPYRPGRVPVVFVHGTFSSPVWWAEMSNTLKADPDLRRHFQFWFFNYNSGNPTIYSAKQLRESLAAKLRELDPEGRDAALRQMVLVGHSQGGLLVKLATIDTDEQLLQAVLKDRDLKELELSEEEWATLRRYTTYEALPFVRRVVFICTPHRGSYLAGNLVRRVTRRVVSLPTAVLKRSTELSGLTEKLDLPEELRGTPTSLDSMSPGNPFLLAIAEIPVAPEVKAHSIIAVRGDGDPREGRDGLVSYASAHIDGVESEAIVRGFHTCQDKPATIEEVRRILHEHLAGLPPGILSQDRDAP